jgi:hypothetical protein
VIHVDQIVNPYPGQPLSAIAEPAAQPGGKQRTHQPKSSAARGLHDAGAHPHHPHPGLLRRRSRVLPLGDDIGQKPVAALAVLGQRLVTAVVSVKSDRRGRDQYRRPFAAACQQFGQPASWANSAVADRVSVTVGEAPGNRGAGQMNNRVDPGAQLGVGVVRVPPSLVVASCGPADQLDDAMTAGAQKRGQRRADQSRGSGDRDGRRGQTVLGGQLVGGQIVGQLTVPVGEHRAQHRPGYPRVDPVDDPGPIVADLFEFVDVPPPHRDPGR